LSIKVAEHDKHVMAEALHARREKNEKETQPSSSSSEVLVSDTLPSQKHLEEEDGWITFDKPILYLYAGQGPYVGRSVALHFTTATTPLLMIFSQ
jgi:sphingosine kinase